MRDSILQLSDFQLKIFIGSFIAMFLIVSIQLLNLTPKFLIKPVPDPDAMSVIHPKLARFTSSYTLKKQSSFFAQAHAEASYDAAISYALIDMATGEVLREKALSVPVPIASLTKIMTAVVALDLMDPEEKITITEKAAKQIPTKIGIVAGQRMTVKELLQATLITSANDAAQAISDGVDKKYGEKIFVRAMNEKASILRLKNTHFTNPQGFDYRNNHSSAEDLAILTHYAMTHYPLFREVVSEEYVFLSEDGSHKQFDLYNWNGLLGVYPNVTGVKIGNTDDAGRTTLVVSERGGKQLMVVLLGAPGILERDLWAAQLLDEGFKDMMGLEPVSVTEDALREKYATWKY